MKRYLGIGVEEWNRLPWWQQQMYVEGIDEEILAASGVTPDREISFDEFAGLTGQM